MKLKKIASLMLAGVMAVSMLAGCSNGTKPDDGEKEPTATGLTGKVIEALDDDITEKVSFTAGSGLQNTLNKMVAYYGADKTNFASNMTDANIVKFDEDLKADELPTLDADNSKVDNDDDVKSTVKVVTLASSDANETYVANMIADEIEKDSVMQGSKKLADLPRKGNDLDSDSTSGVDCYYTFTYTGEVAVAEIDDVVNHATVYVVAYTVTRTPAKNAL